MLDKITAGQMFYVALDINLTVVMTSDPTPSSPGRESLDQPEALVGDVLIPAIRDRS